MVEALLSGSQAETNVLERARSFVGLLQSDLLVDGHEPEQRAVYRNLSWERYLALDKALGDERSGLRLYYLDGTLEIMTISDEHERIKKWLGNFLAMYFEEIEASDQPRGEATMRLALKQAGAEPDESWSIGETKEFPDLVLEIALSSGGVKKLDLYQRFLVPEVWIWRSGKLEIYSLAADDGGYELVPGHSPLLPGLDIASLERCVAILDWPEARKAFRAGLSK